MKAMKPQKNMDSNDKQFLKTSSGPSTRPINLFLVLGLLLGVVLIGAGWYLSDQRQQANQQARPNQTTPAKSAVEPPAQLTSKAEANAEALECAHAIPQMVLQWQQSHPDETGFPSMHDLLEEISSLPEHPCNNMQLNLSGARTLNPEYLYQVDHARGDLIYSITDQSISSTTKEVTHIQ